MNSKQLDTIRKLGYVKRLDKNLEFMLFFFIWFLVLNVCIYFSYIFVYPIDNFNVINLLLLFIYREFEVASINFVGQTHKWRLTEWLQKGTERNRETLLDDLAFALQFILVTARARLFSHFFSIAESINAVLTGFIKLIGI